MQVHGINIGMPIAVRCTMLQMAFFCMNYLLREGLTERPENFSEDGEKMIVIKFGCKNCGSPHMREKENKLHCMSCGHVFSKDVETKEERDARILYLSRLDDAEKMLSLSPPRFEVAEDMYRLFTSQYPKNSDGYWGLVRAKCGIKYEYDITGRKTPSCYKSSCEDSEMIRIS